MKLTLLRHESPTGPSCPAFYRTDAGLIGVVGKKITDPEIRAQMGIADDEDAIFIPESLAPEVLE